MNTNNKIKDQEHWQLLLIEDQASMAKMAAKMITDRWQCQVTITHSLAETQAILANNADTFFLTVADLNLPDAPNGEIIGLLMAHQQKVIAITGYYDKAMHETLMETGLIDYVLKKNINAYEYLTELVGRLYHNSKTTVLVIDDSVSIRRRTGLLLEKQFLNVVYAENGQEGIDILNSRPEIKLVLVDSEMPVMDGLTFTAKARQLKPQSALTIIGISGDKNKDLSTEFLKHGANDFISKPFTYEELTCRVNQNLTLLDYIEEMNKRANLDFLTQVPNRRYFFTNGQTLLKKASGEQATIVGLLDIDYFKKVNDQYGHELGDKVLFEIAQLIQRMLPDQLIGRIGGEEFGFILNMHSQEQAHTLVTRLHESIAEHEIDHKNGKLSVTVSIGYTSLPPIHLEEALQIADRHLYLAKQSGRNIIIDGSKVFA